LHVHPQRLLKGIALTAWLHGMLVVVKDRLGTTEEADDSPPLREAASGLGGRLHSSRMHCLGRPRWQTAMIAQSLTTTLWHCATVLRTSRSGTIVMFCDAAPPRSATAPRRDAAHGAA
jgi:hypothetical protein